jgi:membrane protease YdiL (CAAX protease family)
MTTHARSRWINFSLSLRAIVSGLLLALVAANVWPLLLLNLAVPLAAVAEAVFLALFVWWASGRGPPLTTQNVRAMLFRCGFLSRRQWAWSLVAALFFAVTVHASIALLFRLVPFPMADFRRGYDLSFIPSAFLRWLAVVVSAVSAGICEETGFRGYLKRPLEQRHGAPVAILISSLFFMLVHLSKSWATAGMVPIVFGAGLLLGHLARSSGSLIPGMVGHVLMDIGLFAYCWTGMAGNFTWLPMNKTGLDAFFAITCVTLAVALFIVLLAISKIRRVEQKRVAPGQVMDQ